MSNKSFLHALYEGRFLLVYIVLVLNCSFYLVLSLMPFNLIARILLKDVIATHLNVKFEISLNQPKSLCICSVSALRSLLLNSVFQ